MKIFCYTDLQSTPDALFWHRDLGLLTKTLRELGHEAWLIVHPKLESSSSIQNQKSRVPSAPVIWASTFDVRNPVWWKSHSPDLVILGLWTRPKYDPVRRAASAATPRIIERADSDGMRTASCGMLTYAKRRYDYFRDYTYQSPTGFSIASSLFYSLASILATPWIEARLARTLGILPALAIETPRATSLWKRLATRLGCDPARIHYIPHPIQTDIFQPAAAIHKKNLIISVGRWDAYQKNLPLLLNTLVSFLNQNQTWKALVVGSGLPACPPHPGILFSDFLPPVDLASRMQEAKIFLSSSRYESFGLAGAEAAACGCHLVFPRNCVAPKEAFCPSHGESLLGALLRASKDTAQPSEPIPIGKASPISVAKDFLAIAKSL